MSQQQQQAQLKDVLSYTPETYFTDEEIKLIQNTFKYNPHLLKVLRKVMIPTVADPDLPIEEFAHDAYLAGKSWAQIPASERGTMILARQEAVEFVIGGLIKLKQMAHTEVETEEQTNERRKKDSTK